MPDQLIFGILDGKSVLRGSTFISYYDISIGVPAALLCVESIFVALLNMRAFGSGEYAARGVAASDSADSLKLSGNGAQFSKGGAEPKDSSKLGFGEAVLSALDPRDLASGFVYAVQSVFGSK